MLLLRRIFFFFVALACWAAGVFMMYCHQPYFCIVFGALGVAIYAYMVRKQPEDDDYNYYKKSKW